MYRNLKNAKDYIEKMNSELGGAIPSVLENPSAEYPSVVDVETTANTVILGYILITHYLS